MAALGVELISSRLKAYQEISTVIVLATAIGLAGIFTSLTGGSNAISSYLFGSIVTIGDFELALVLVVAAVVLVTYRLIYDRLYLSAFDPVAAPLMGIDGRALNLAFSFLVAITVSVAAKTIGSLIVSSLMVIPVICAMQFARSYRGTLLLSIALSLAFVHAGLAVSYHQNLRPGSVIVLIAVLALSVAMLAKRRWGYL
ncbi:metal ABC transporter permease [Olsenella phocaeensis]|uniref:metal ABC transporter permease n=1 Tax=Olsenella phocaeensis TaxID=1852385 RepID=UPI003A937D21